MSENGGILDDKELQKIYSCVDEIPLSRPKRHITRDFSDGGEATRFGKAISAQEIYKHIIYPVLSCAAENIAQILH
jgi:hypothetical protein